MDHFRHELSEMIESSRISMGRDELIEASTRVMKYAESYSYHPPQPKCIQTIPPEIQRKHTQLDVPDLFVCELYNIHLVGPNATAITPDHKYILENAGGKSKIFTDSILRVLYNRQIPLRYNTDTVFSDPIINMSGAQSKTFFHWFVDYLPRLRGVEEYRLKTGRRPIILIPDNAPEWLLHSLNFMGVPDDQLKTWSDQRLTLEQFVVPTFARQTSENISKDGYTYHPRLLKWVSDQMKSALNVHPDHSRILITRDSASSRQIENIDSTISLVKRYGFQPVNLTQMSLRDQINLFRNVEVVIAPHGAGLTNIIHSSDIQVIELFGEFTSPLYYSIATGLGHEYAFTISDDVRLDNRRTIVDNRDNKNILVDLDILQELLDSWISDSITC